MGILYPRALVLLQFVLDLRLENRLSQWVPAGWEGAVGLGGRAIAGNLGLGGALDGVATHTVAVRPQRVRVVKNGYREADEASVTLDYGVFPFDPRLARAIAMEVHLGTVGSAWEDLAVNRQII